MDIMNKYRQLAQNALSEKRFRHTLGVASAAEKLAAHYGLDANKAVVAAFLHDIAKEETFERQLQYCAEFGILLSDFEKKSPKLLHALTAAGYAKHRLHVTDTEILDAVRYHTTGRKYMSGLEKVVYLADFIEENRNFPGVDEVRAIAYQGLDGAMIAALANTICEVVNKPSLLHWDTVECYNQLIMDRKGETQ